MAKEMPCTYGACVLPKNNGRYLWQLAYVILGLGVLFYDIKSFTFFQTFLFVAPVFLDIAYVDIRKSKTLNWIRIVFGIYDSIFLLMCTLGIAGVIEDQGEYFAISNTFLYFQGFSVEKAKVGIAIAINLIVPFVLWIGAPCQQGMHILNVTRGGNEKQEGVMV